jgi:hypothetical protein
VKELLLELGLVVAIAAVSAAAGAQWMSHQDAKAVQAAHGDTKSCLDSNQSIQSALDKVQQVATAQDAQLAAQRVALAEAIDQRNKALAQISKNAQARVHALEKTAHETPSCQSLASLPVCPAVGDRLWGDVARRDTTAGY